MDEYKPTPKQIKALVDASENLAAYFAMDICRVMDEFPDETNVIPYLSILPVKVVREFDEAIVSILHGAMDSSADEAEQRRKYEQAMAECRPTQPNGACDE